MPFSAYDPETVVVLKKAMADALSEYEARQTRPLSPGQRAAFTVALTKQLLYLAENGERDPQKLKTIALISLTSR